MKKSYKSIKKLAKQTFEKYSINKVTPEIIKDVINAQGFTVIKYSLTEPSEQTTRLMQTLSVLQYASFHNSFTYSGLSKKIVFIRSDISEDEYFYLLILELGRILTHTEKTDNLIGVTVPEASKACEFAYHITDCANHGIIYNLFKFHPIKAPLMLFAAGMLILFCAVMPFYIKNSGIYAETPDQSYSAVLNDNISSVSNNISFPDYSTPSTNENDLSSRSDEYSSQNSESVSDESEVGFVIPENERVFYATKSGKKYHISGCSYISGKETIELSSDDIESKNYSPCSRCFP